MQTLDHDQVSVHIDAPPEAVYALVADVTRMSELSGGPGESHPRAPTDPGVTVSRHRALLALTGRRR